MQAHAYAQGSDIHLGPGQEKHLPHEAWHVVQQKQGRVQPTTQLKGKFQVNDDQGLEKEADVMGEKAILKNTISTSHDNLKSIKISASNKTIQGKLFEIRKVTEIDKKIMEDSSSKISKLNKAIDKYNSYKSGRNISREDAIQQFRTLITISSLAEQVKMESGNSLDLKTMQITFSNIKSEIAFIQSILDKVNYTGKDIAAYSSNSNSNQSNMGNQNAHPNLRTESPEEEQGDNPLIAGKNHFSPSMEATVLAPVDATSLALAAAADENMGEEISSVDGANSGLGIGLSAVGQITAISTMILATKNILDANKDIKENSDNVNKSKIAKEERQEAIVELLNGATALVKTTASMADTIVNLNPQNLADSVLSSATQASGSVAGAAGIVWNAYQLIINAVGAEKARKAYSELNKEFKVDKEF